MSLVNQIALPSVINFEEIFISNDALNEEKQQQTAKSYKKGAMVYLQDETANQVFYLKKGRVKISSYSQKGKEMTKQFVEKGEIFGELSILGKEKCDDFAIVLEDAVVYAMPKSVFHEKMQSSHKLSHFMIEKLGKALIQAEQRLEDMIFESSRKRVINFLKNLALTKGIKIGFETLVRDWYTHQEIANFTATSRQTVTTILNELRRENVIYFNRYKLLVRDMELLD